MKNDRITRLIRYICLIATIVLVMFVYFKERKEEFLFCQHCRIVKELEIHGIVSAIDNPKKGCGIIIFNNGLILSNTYTVISVDEYFAPGDSIFKPSGQFKYYIYKNRNKDNCIVIEKEYDCGLECNDSIYYNKIKALQINSIVKDMWPLHFKNDYVLIFENNFHLYRNYTGENIEEYVSVGDSIYKPSGLFKYYIYKQGNKDNPVIVEGDCGCDD